MITAGTTCSKCGGEVYAGEVAGYTWNVYGEGRVMCRDCIRDEIMSLPDDELFAALGYEPEEVQARERAPHEAYIGTAFRKIKEE